MSEQNDNSNESNSLGSDSMFQASRLSGGAAVNTLLRTSVLRPSVLGPSVLVKNSTAAVVEDDAASTQTTEIMASNPFMKDDDENEKAVDGEVNKVIASPQKLDDKKHEHGEDSDERPDPLNLLRQNGLERSNLFAATKNSIPRVERSGFVFGQNLHERVVGENLQSKFNSKSDCDDEAAPSGGAFLFSSVIQNAAKSYESDGAAAATKETETKSLDEVAREYEESRAQKRKYEEVKTFTGEENEVNVVDINCKFFAFVNSNWEERGRGSMRLNDSKIEGECSRVVFRTSGNLRVLLNTKVWGEMVADRSSQKSLRITAMDNAGKIKVFLIMARPVDINLLHKELVSRIEKRKATHSDESFLHFGENNEVDSSKNGTSKHDEDDLDEVAEVEEEQAAGSLKPQDELDEPSPKKTPSLAGEQ